MAQVSETPRARSGKSGPAFRKDQGAGEGGNERASTGTDDVSAEGAAEQTDGSEKEASSIASPIESEAVVYADEDETPTLADAVAPVSDEDDDKPITIDELKETIMASNNDDMNKAADSASSTVTNAVSEMQNRTKAAYEKGSEAMTELSDFAKGNVEALVESSKIVASGLQELGRSYSEEARAAYEQMSADMKEVAAVKSPTELFQLQARIMRRNFETLMSANSKNTEAMMKLVNEAFQPLSGRVNAAADKASKLS